LFFLFFFLFDLASSFSFFSSGMGSYFFGG